MPGIELLDYTRGDHITDEMRDETITTVHDVLEQFNGKRPKHTNFRYSLANYLDVSCYDSGNNCTLNTDAYDYILVVDGEKTGKTLELKDEIRTAIKELVARVLEVPEEAIAVRYRVYDSSFG